MSVDAHRRAEALAAEAERLLADGRKEEAAQRYLLAARSEEQALQRIPEARAKTRGILAVSAAALYQKAGALDEAAQLAQRALAGVGQQVLPDFAREQLQKLLDDAQREQQASP